MMKNNSYADEIAATKVLISGLKANGEKLGKRGIDADFMARLETVYAESQSLDNEQEALKSRLKEKTAALDETIAVMQKLHSEAKKLVKIEMPKESWKEFGITDTR